MILALALAVLAQSPAHRLFMQPNLPRSAPACAADISCAVAAGDKSGGWWMLKGDGTMAASSALTMAAQGSPGVSPLTFAAGAYYKSGSVAAPTGSFSFVVSFKVTALGGTQFLMGKWPNHLQWLLYIKADGTLEYYVKAGDATLWFIDSAAPITAGSWLAVGGTHNGAGSVTGLTLRINGTSTVSGTSGVGPFSASDETSVFAENDGSAPFTGSSRGVFYTEKILSDADLDRIMAGAL